MDAIYDSKYKLDTVDNSQTMEKWQNILDITREKLSQTENDNKKKAQTHLLLANCYFYLHQLEEVEKHILDSLRLSYNTDLDIHLRGLNLLACYFRTKITLGEEYHEKKLFFHKGLASLLRALAYARQSTNRVLQAEVFFNAGDFFTHEFSNRTQDGINYYMKAMQIFRRECLVEYYLETKIHLTKAYLQEKKYSQAKKLMKEICEEMDSQKENNTHNKVMEKVLTQSLGNTNDALFLLMEVMTWMQEVGMKKNFQEIQDKIQVIQG